MCVCICIYIYIYTYTCTYIHIRVNPNEPQSYPMYAEQENGRGRVARTVVAPPSNAVE